MVELEHALKELPANSEIHVGLVEKDEGDYVQVEILSPRGLDYTQNFESELFSKADISVGDLVLIAFSKEIVEPGMINVRMIIKDMGPALPDEEIHNRIRSVMKDLDLDLIKETFGVHTGE